jgi:large subunit ribosomal protein L29
MAVGISPGELRELTDEELIERLRESKEELFNLRFQMATGQLSNNRRLRTVRHEIARIYTVLRERELGLASGPGGEDSSWQKRKPARGPQRRRPRRRRPRPLQKPRRKIRRAV